MSENMLNIENLVIHYETDEEVVEAVNNISFQLKKGEVLGLVGETGAGKTTTALGIMGLLPSKVGHVIQGKIELDGENLFDKSEREMRKIRGKKISMIFQDPMTALNPVKTVGDQISEVVLLHNHCSKAEALKRAQDMLAMVGIVPERYKDYPHQFSGGMKQRIVIAIALACEPELLIADEPTTALDVTIQAQILNLLQDLQAERGLTYMFITHDMSVVKHISDDIAVMYLGQLIEKCPANEIFKNTIHPYSQALLSAIPIPNVHVKKERMILKGELTSPIDPKPCCRFAARCPYATEECMAKEPELREVKPNHFVACHYAEKFMK